MKPDATFSRRRLLRSAPALAAVTMPVAATVLSGIPAGDAELLALGRKLAPLAAEATPPGRSTGRTKKNSTPDWQPQG